MSETEVVLVSLSWGCQWRSGGRTEREYQIWGQDNQGGREGTSLVVQRLRFCTHNAGGPDSIPCQRTRSHMLQLRKIPHATAKTVKVLVTQLCPTLCNPMDCSPSGSPVREILQARILEWFDISFSRGTSQPRDQTWVSHILSIFFTL